ncbi:putative selenoprotein [Uruburuella testudinis]|uniref:Selenoprotein n=1 Tax=Uruburuella testudinis TaxID=1282863 RepID=A0ABY4DWY7_9NEIS|nr:CstA-like transporter-associated (seleno)protein [Uruburuella testudinis]UOO82584.1 putative selenoprotein [Uruburuella testudinis]
MKPDSDLKGRLKNWYTSLRIFAYYMAGIPDYDNYVARQRRYNAQAPVMSRLEFLDYCQQRRNGSGRCC